MELGIGLGIHISCHFIYCHVQLWLGLRELGIGLMELGIGLRINSARRTVLARVSGLVFPLFLLLLKFFFFPRIFFSRYVSFSWRSLLCLSSSVYPIFSFSLCISLSLVFSLSVYVCLFSLLFYLYLSWRFHLILFSVQSTNVNVIVCNQHGCLTRQPEGQIVS